MVLFKCINKEGGVTERGIPAAFIVEVSSTNSSPQNCWIRYTDGNGGAPRPVCVKGTVVATIRRINNVT